MTTYTEPKTEDLARLAAKAIGCVYHACHLFTANADGMYDHHSDVVRCNFSPEDDHNDAQFLVDEAFKRGLGLKYVVCLQKQNGKFYSQSSDEKYMCLASPENKTRAFLRAVHESTTNK